MRQSKKIKIGVSSCLLGNRVRYDGEHQYQKAVDALREEFELIPFCPEVEIGLGVPRPKIQLVKTASGIRCFDFDTHTIDYTDELKECCVRQNDWLKSISGYILKTKSPSCGMTKVKTDYDGEIRADGQGIFAASLKLLYPTLPLIEEDELNDKEKAFEFIDKVIRFNKEIE